MSIKLTLQNIIELSRIKKITGVWLLLLPCLFGILISYKDNIDNITKISPLNVFLLFFLGSIVMRTAGCVVNDIADSKLDAKVTRTQNRPLANKSLNINIAIIFLAILLIIGLIILLQFNQLTIKMGILALLLVILYPFTKRFTYYPQLFLGITFNFGILLAGCAINNKISMPILLFYISSILWTLVYDTIYAYQDIEDDIKIGNKSSAIIFGPEPQKILYTLSTMQIILLAIAGFLIDFSISYYLIIYTAFLYIIFLIKSCDFKNEKDCLKKFKSNVTAGLIILMAIITG